MFFFGLFGLGKILISYIIVKEMEINIKIIVVFMIEKSGDLVVILINL